jgi:hypothetical protein
LKGLRDGYDGDVEPSGEPADRRLQAQRQCPLLSVQQAKTALIRLRIEEKQRVLMPVIEHDALVERLVGLFLSGLSGFGAKCGGRDMATRRAIDQAVFDLRVQIAEAANMLADETGEPPLDDAA